MKVSIYEQELFGLHHWRVMRDDGRLIFDRHQTDFPSEEEAVSAVRGYALRNHITAGEITVYRLDRQANGRNRVGITLPLVAAVCG